MGMPPSTTPVGKAKHCGIRQHNSCRLCLTRRPGVCSRSSRQQQDGHLSKDGRTSGTCQRDEQMPWVLLNSRICSPAAVNWMLHWIAKPQCSSVRCRSTRACQNQSHRRLPKWWWTRSFRWYDRFLRSKTSSNDNHILSHEAATASGARERLTTDRRRRIDFGGQSFPQTGPLQSADVNQISNAAVVRADAQRRHTWKFKKISKTSRTKHQEQQQKTTAAEAHKKFIHQEGPPSPYNQFQ